MSFPKEFQHFKISLEDIKSATNNFGDSNFISEGGYGKVYKGEFLLSGGLTMVAVKRFRKPIGNDSRKFLQEIMMLSAYKHENLISLVGFCDDNGERILVHEYHVHKSLDLNLSSTDLSWTQRLHICIGAARGLCYLHDIVDSHHRFIHHDFKSSKILLDQNWNAKIAYTGLSKPLTWNHQYSIMSSLGTIGYLDPQYVETGTMTKKSNVYSFGVVLFEVLCGRLSVVNYENFHLPRLAQKHYKDKKMDAIIPTSIQKQISPGCLERFSAVAYQCLQREGSERPSMTVIVKELELALQYQVEYERNKEKELLHDDEDSESDEGEYWETKLPQDWKVMITRFNIPRAVHTIKREVFSLLNKGILFDEGNKFLWIDNDGKKCVMISARRFLKLSEGYDHSWLFQHGGLRFPVVAAYHYGKWHEIRCQIKTSILSVGCMYAAKLVFKYTKKPNEDLKHVKMTRIHWKMKDLSVYSIHNAELTQDNWYKIRMWNFINHESNADFDIVIEELSYYDDPVESDILIQGVEFQPIEMHEEIEGIKSPLILDKEDKDDDLYWEKKLPKDYQDFIQMSDKHLHYTSKKELFFLLCEGFSAYSGKMWLSLCKSTGGICSMLPATRILCRDANYESLETLSLSESRFREVKELGTDDWYLFTCRLRPFMFSPHYIYACYLVFKFEENHFLSNDDGFCKAKYKLGDTIRGQGTVFAHLTWTPTINIPTIKPMNDHGSHDPSSSLPTISEELDMPKGFMEHSLNNSWVEERKDGWMELRLSKPLSQLETHNSLEVKFWKSKGGNFSGIIVEGMEFRPMHDVSDV